MDYLLVNPDLKPLKSYRIPKYPINPYKTPMNSQKNPKNTNPKQMNDVYIYKWDDYLLHYIFFICALGYELQKKQFEMKIEQMKIEVEISECNEWIFGEEVVVDKNEYIYIFIFDRCQGYL